MSNILRRDPLDDLFRGFFVRPVELGNTGLVPEAPAIRMDVRENNEAFVVHAELPGVRKEDIHVTIDGNLVAITAEVKEVKEEKESRNGERVLRAERYYGKLSRSFQLAQDIDDGKAAARFSNGVLELTLPKRAASASKRLAID